MGFPPNISTICCVRGRALISVPNAGNYPTPFGGMFSWFYNGLGAAASQLVSRAPTEVFWSIYCC